MTLTIGTHIRDGGISLAEDVGIGPSGSATIAPLPEAISGDLVVGHIDEVVVAVDGGGREGAGFEGEVTGPEGEGTLE